MEDISPRLTQELFRQLGHELVSLRADVMRLMIEKEMLTNELNQLKQETQHLRKMSQDTPSKPSLVS